MSAVALQSFGFGDQLVRATDMQGAAWFVANDVCGALEISNARDAVSKLDEDEKGVVTTDTLGGPQQVSIISESGVYSLIFKSRKPSAVAFRKWVTGQVLPTIRQTGKFETVPTEPMEQIVEAGTPEFIERVRTGLQLVREARIVFGIPAARRAWVVAGLPDVSPAAEGASHLQYLDAKAQAVARWFAERIDMVTGTRENATALYMDFSKWCDEANEESVTIKRFGKVLTELGIDKIHSNGCYYLGVRLKS